MFSTPQKNIQKKVLSSVLPALVFLLPWQTAYIFSEGELGGLSGVWQYGTIQLYGLDLVLVTLLALAVGTAWRAKAHGEPPLPVEVFLLIVLVSASFFSIIFASDRAIAFIGAFRLLEGVGVYLLLRTVPFSMRSLAGWWVFGAVVQSALAIQQFAAQEVVANSWLGMAFHSPKMLGDAVVENADVRWMRAYGSFVHPNILAVYGALGLAFLFFLVHEIEQKWKLYVLFLCGACITAGLFFTFSRDGWIALVCAGGASGVAVFLRRKKSGPTSERFSPVLVCALVCIMTAVLLSAVWWEPLSVRLGMQGWQRLELKSTNERIDGIRGALSLAPRHMEGIGIGNYTRVLASEKRDASRRFASEYQPVHAVPLLILLEVGLLGFVAWALLIGYRIRRCFSNGVRPIDTALALLLIVPLFFDHFYWTLFSGVLMWWVGFGIFCKKGT
ncbi:O-antigen ligase family protein [Candidatus Uhrbacteria bacterium]|nr:O-antigen ligase family protein [Candidatus Uhrbacteria bacterium]